MIERLPGYVCAKLLHKNPSLPMNYTLGVTYKCNSRCKSCRIYERETTYEMSAKEWRGIFIQLAHSPYWITFTGGEPFLYNDLVETYWDLVETCSPKMINIPTNGLLTERIVDWTWQMCKMKSKTSLTINVSIDGIKDENDYIRGVPSAYEKALETVKKLQELKVENLNVGIHTVISRFNVANFKTIYKTLSPLVKPSFYITEIAENRNELGTMGINIAPTAQEYKEAVGILATGRGIKGFLRERYYKNVIEKKKLPCYAGYASCQITPNGDVWPCCMKARSVGNVLNESFRDIWTGEDICHLREVQDCNCTLANAAYTNMILSPWSLL